MKAIPRILALVLLGLVATAPLHAAPDSSSAAAPTEYKLLANFKQPFNDDLQYHLSKGWKPVGGVAVTVWNNDLYFAQLIGRAGKSAQ
jgi:hypothetical protein